MSIFKFKNLIGFLVVFLVGFICFGFLQNEEPWSNKQLMAPEELVENISNENYHVYNIGPAGLIKNAEDVGDGRSEEARRLLGQKVSGLAKDAKIVIYCGCCPFEDCPNIRPTFELLNNLGYTNHYLLNLPSNLKVDWIDKGYPMTQF